MQKIVKWRRVRAEVHEYQYYMWVMVELTLDYSQFICEGG